MIHRDQTEYLGSLVLMSSRNPQNASSHYFTTAQGLPDNHLPFTDCHCLQHQLNLAEHRKNHISVSLNR